MKCSAALLLVLALIGCRASTGSETESTRSENYPVGLYVFDGTNLKIGDNSILKRFHDRAVVKSKHYFEGTDFFATNMLEPDAKRDSRRNSNNLIYDGIRKICADVETHKLKYVFLAGYSRGAVAALTVVRKAKEICGKPIPFRWVGLVDTADTAIPNIETLPSEMPPASEIACLHIFKDHVHEGILTTKEVRYCSNKIRVQGVNHEGFVEHQETLTNLISNAMSHSRGTLKFSDSPVVPVPENIQVDQPVSKGPANASAQKQADEANPRDAKVVTNASPLGGSLKIGSPVKPPPQSSAPISNSPPSVETCQINESAVSCLNAGCYWDLFNGMCSPVK